MINVSDELLNSYKNPPQLANLWDFYLTDWNEVGMIDGEKYFDISRFKVVSTNLPLPSLTYETHNTGQKYYSGYEMPDTFSITLREDTKFSVYNYFKKWMGEIFDLKTGTFISNDVPNTKTGVLSFQTYKFDKDSIYTQFKQRIQSNLSGIKATFSGQVMENLAGEKLRHLEKENPSMGDFFSMEITQEFIYHNVRLLGISDISVDYENDSQLQLEVNLTVDAISDSLEEEQDQTVPNPRVLGIEP